MGHMRGKLYQFSTNDIQGLYHTGEGFSYKIQVLSHMGENKLFYIIFCDENHRSRKPYLVNYLTKYYTYKVQVSNHTGEKPLYSLKCYCRTHTKESPYQHS